MSNTLSTKTFNFVPDEDLARWIEKAVKWNQQAMLELAYQDILWDEKRQMWVKLPEEDFDRRRLDPWGNNESQPG